MRACLCRTLPATTDTSGDPRRRVTNEAGAILGHVRAERNRVSVGLRARAWQKGRWAPDRSYDGITLSDSGIPVLPGTSPTRLAGMILIDFHRIRSTLRRNEGSMSLTRDEVRRIIDVYLCAWSTRDPDLIVTIFTPTAIYHERVLEAPIRNRDGIRAYWRTKVVTQQANITAELLNLYLDGTTAIAEWEACFDDLVAGHRKRIREVAILEFDGDRIASLREYWASERLS